MALIATFRELDVYRNAMELAMNVFDLTRRFPAEERYSMTDQMRRSSRSVCANLAEAWRKRRYEAAFVSKLSDAETEAAETQVWIELAARCGYIDTAVLQDLTDRYEKVISQIIRMAESPERWVIRPRGSRVKERLNKPGTAEKQIRQRQGVADRKASER